MTPSDTFARIREMALKHLNDDNKDKIHVIVQLSKCSQAVGAREVLDTLKRVVSEEGMENVTVDITGCMGFCSREPIVTIKKDGKKPVVYCNVTPDRARVMLVEYVYRDTVIMPWILK
jgi:NADP-reducing hydrogenase subunit HndB